MVAGPVLNDYFPPPMTPRSFRLRCTSLLPLAALLASTACNLQGTGDPPGEGEIYFPAALALSPDDRFLYVVNSNFDRRFSHGSLQSFELEKLGEVVDKQCSGKKAGISCEIDPQEALHSEVLIDSLGRGMAVAEDGKRIYIPTQASGALTYVNVSGNGKLECGGHRTCSAAYMRGLDKDESGGVSDGKKTPTFESTRRLVLPADPVAITSMPLQDLPGSNAGADAGDAVIVAHRNGTLSLFVNDGEGRPSLAHVLSGLYIGITGLAFDPESGLLHLTFQYAGDTVSLKTMQRVGLSVVSKSLTQKLSSGKSRTFDSYLTSYLFAAGQTAFYGVDTGPDTWAVAFDATTNPDEVLVLSRRPDALLQLYMAPDGLSADVRNIVEVGNGAARMVTGTIMGPEGPRNVAAVSCITERRVFVIDVESGDVLSIVPGFSGPFVMALDGSHARLYVADFRSSTVRILDIEPVLRRESARVVATLGHLRQVDELK